MSFKQMLRLPKNLPTQILNQIFENTEEMNIRLLRRNTQKITRRFAERATPAVQLNE